MSCVIPETLSFVYVARKTSSFPSHVRFPVSLSRVRCVTVSRVARGPWRVRAERECAHSHHTPATHILSFDTWLLYTVVIITVDSHKKDSRARHKTGPSRDPASKLNRSRAYTRAAPCQESLQSGDAPGGVVGPASVLPDSPGPRRAALRSGGDSGGTGAAGSSRTLTALTSVGHAAAGATTESAARAG